MLRISECFVFSLESNTYVTTQAKTQGALQKRRQKWSVGEGRHSEMRPM